MCYSRDTQLHFTKIRSFFCKSELCCLCPLLLRIETGGCGELILAGIYQGLRRWSLNHTRHRKRCGQPAAPPSQAPYLHYCANSHVAYDDPLTCSAMRGQNLFPSVCHHQQMPAAFLLHFKKVRPGQGLLRAEGRKTCSVGDLGSGNGKGKSQTAQMPGRPGCWCSESCLLFLLILLGEVW